MENPHENVAWRIQLPRIKMSLSKLDTRKKYKLGQPWTKGSNSSTRDLMKSTKLLWSAHEVQLKPTTRVLPTNPQVLLHTPVLTSQPEGLTNNPQTTITQLEGLTNHPQLIYPTRGPYQPPSALFNCCQLTEGLTNHPLKHICFHLSWN